jgi:hypothetical protein
MMAYDHTVDSSVDSFQENFIAVDTVDKKKRKTMSTNKRSIDWNGSTERILVALVQKYEAYKK